jgi:membrane protein YqaA with SNARE-associated domain
LLINATPSDSVLKKIIPQLQKFLDRPWYIPFISFLVFLDFFIFVVPADAILISSAIVKPKKWLSLALWVAVGSSLGALCATLLFQTFAADWFSHARQYIHHWGGWAVWFSAVGPVPIHPAVFAAAAAGMNPWHVFLWVLLGRVMKYCFFTWLAAKTPRFKNNFKWN